VIPKGTAGAVLASDGLYRPTTLAGSQLQEGAITDPSVLAGKVATRDIYPGQQLMASDFVAGGDGVRGRISGAQRAIAVPIDAAHGLLGQVRSGDRVDVLAGFNTSSATTGRGRPTLRTLVRNVLVLQVPGADQGGGVGGGGTAATASNIVVRVDDAQAARLAFAADNGKIWFVLRPPVGATDSSRAAGVDLDSIMSDTKPIQVGG
jgi:pilus assembly protein CpaB